MPTKRCSEREPAVRLAAKIERRWRPAPVADLCVRSMTNGYTTAFQVSYFSNGTLSFSVVALFASLFVAGVAAVIYGRLSAAQAETARRTFFYFRLVPLVCA